MKALIWDSGTKHLKELEEHLPKNVESHWCMDTAQLVEKLSNDYKFVILDYDAAPNEVDSLLSSVKDRFNGKVVLLSNKMTATEMRDHQFSDKAADAYLSSPIENNILAQVLAFPVNPNSTGTLQIAKDTIDGHLSRTDMTDKGVAADDAVQEMFSDIFDAEDFPGADTLEPTETENKVEVEDELDIGFELDDDLLLGSEEISETIEDNEATKIVSIPSDLNGNSTDIIEGLEFGSSEDIEAVDNSLVDNDLSVNLEGEDLGGLTLGTTEISLSDAGTVEKDIGDLLQNDNTITTAKVVEEALGIENEGLAFADEVENLEVGEEPVVDEGLSLEQDDGLELSFGEVDTDSLLESNSDQALPVSSDEIEIDSGLELFSDSDDSTPLDLGDDLVANLGHQDIDEPMNDESLGLELQEGLDIESESLDVETTEDLQTDAALELPTSLPDEIDSTDQSEILDFSLEEDQTLVKSGLENEEKINTTSDATDTSFDIGTVVQTGGLNLDDGTREFRVPASSEETPVNTSLDNVDSDPNYDAKIAEIDAMMSGEVASEIVEPVKVEEALEDKQEQLVISSHEDASDIENSKDAISEGTGELLKLMKDQSEVMGAKDLELTKLLSYIGSLRSEKQGLQQDITAILSEREHDSLQVKSLQSELDEKNIENELMRKKFNQKLEEYKYSAEVYNEKRTFLEKKNIQFKTEIDDLNKKLKIDLNVVRRREKELENQLELLKEDTNIQLKNRDQKILELKRKIDMLEFELETTLDKERQSKATKTQLESKMDNVISTLKDTIGNLESDRVGFDSKKDYEM